MENKREVIIVLRLLQSHSITNTLVDVYLTFLLLYNVFNKQLGQLIHMLDYIFEFLVAMKKDL